MSYHADNTTPEGGGALLSEQTRKKMRGFNASALLFNVKAWLPVAALALAACGDNNNPGLPPINPGANETPVRGQTDFVAADGRSGEQTQENDRAEEDDFNAAPPAAGAPDEERTAEQGDIYRMIAGTNLLLNLNAYRGLQIINLADPSNPQIIGRVQVSGTPVEMYQVGDRVYILLNDWYHYGWGSQHEQALPERHHGGGVVVVDIANTSAPKVTGTADVTGWITTSRLTRGNGQEALYVVANQYNGGGETFVSSFSVSGQGKLEAKSTLQLGGYVQDIQATGDRLMVARHDWNNQASQGRSELAMVDISSPDGTMVEGASILLKGMIKTKFNMDLHQDILRVVSGNSWGNTANTNHVETYDFSDINAPTPIDHKTFGDNEDLYATLFMGEKAFFVTYRRVDPFHAFEITEQGLITEKSEFIVSGWNDYFQAVAAQTRLIGIGKNDVGQNGELRNTMAVSLYDVTDLTNPNPLITRAELTLNQSWSEAQWDDRAFSVLEKGTDVLAPNGTRETGLVLLPFSGWNETEQRYISAVQIFTFSNNTLTLRATMDHGSPVRRSFVADIADKTTANLSEAELSLFNTANPSQPQELGRLDLAPDYADFKVYGQHGARQLNRDSSYSWWGNRSATQRQDSVQIVPLSGDVDADAPVAEIDIPSGAQTFKVGELLVALTTSYSYDQATQKETYTTDLEAWDLTHPTQPAARGALTSTDLPPSYNSYGGWGPGCGRGGFANDCVVAGYRYGSWLDQGVHATDRALVFTEAKSHNRLEGTDRVRYISPAQNLQYYNSGCYTNSPSGEYTHQACTFYSGQISCSQLTRTNGTVQNEVCSGALYQCTQNTAGERDCAEVPASSVQTTENQWTNERRRYWQSYDLHIVDLSNPASPVVRPKLSSPSTEEAAGIVVEGDKVHVSYKTPVTLPNDSRPYVRYYVKTIDLSNPASPVVSQPVNVPGRLIAAEANTLLTEGLLWGQAVVETTINKLTRQGNIAVLQGTHRFQDQLVNQVTLDHAGHALVSHQNSWYYNGNQSSNQDYTNRLSVLDLQGNTLSLMATTDVDSWASLQDARAGRALFQVPGGLLVMNLDNPAAPFAQAYFPTKGWPRDIHIHNNDIFFSAGQHGLYRFDLNETNLTQP